MTLLILGAGGREHALAWRLALDPGATSIICAPGNPGMSDVASVQPLAGDDPDAAAALATHVGADLTIVGPEVPLSRGVVDRFSSAGLPIVGPTQAAAALETSKTFATTSAEDEECHGRGRRGGSGRLGGAAEMRN